MRKKSILAIIALIGLSSFVVLGSSPSLFSKILESVQNNPITGVFSISDRATKQSEQKNVSNQLPTAQDSLTQKVPQPVLWDMVFRLSKTIKIEAEKLTQEGKDGSLYANYFVRQGHLSAENDVILKDTSNRYLAEVDTLNQKAAKFIEESRDEYLKKEFDKEQSPRISPTELKELQKQKDEMTLQYRDSFRELIGEVSFNSFSSFLILEFSSGITKYELKKSGNQPLSPETNYANNILIVDNQVPTISGVSDLSLDYNTGFYYNPRVYSSLYNGNTGATIHYGVSTGNHWLTAARVTHPTYSAVRGNTYCLYAQFYLVESSPFRPNKSFSSFATSDEDDVKPPVSLVRNDLGHTTFDSTGEPLQQPTSEFFWFDANICYTIPFPSPTPTPTPTATPTPVPTPSPTPCNPAIASTCFPEQVQVFVSSPLRPIGVSNGTTKSGVFVCVCTGAFCVTPLPNRNVELKVLGVPNTGGHIDSGHSGPRPLGKLDKTSGTTGANGCFFTQYNPSHISSTITIEGKSGNKIDTEQIFVGVLGLTQLVDGQNFRIKPNPDTAHPSNAWGSTEAVVAFPRIADAYKDRFYPNPMPDDDKLRVNEISLVSGGKFDLASPSRGIPVPNWHNLSAVHRYHREGNSIDVRCCSSPGQIPLKRFAIFEQLVRNNGATDFLYEPNPAHFHLSFNNEPNRVTGLTNPLNVHTPHSFIENAWEGALGRFATQEEWEFWHNRMVQAKLQGITELLVVAKGLQAEMYGSQEYILRFRNDEDFIKDVFLSYLFREPTEAELQFWLNHYYSIAPPVPVPEEDLRQWFLNDFGSIMEFENLVIGMVDGEVIMPPTPTPTP